MYERDPAVASMATYALLARLAATIVKRMELSAQGEKTLPFADRDRRGLHQLRELLFKSIKGAELISGASTAGLSEPSDRRTRLDEKLESHEVVSRTLPQGKNLDEFVRSADTVLIKLDDGQWTALSPGEQQFVKTDLRRFLDNLSHAPDLVAASHPGESSYSTLA